MQQYRSPSSAKKKTQAAHIKIIDCVIFSELDLTEHFAVFSIWILVVFFCNTAKESYDPSTPKVHNEIHNYKLTIPNYGL